MYRGWDASSPACAAARARGSGPARRARNEEAAGEDALSLLPPAAAASRRPPPPSARARALHKRERLFPPLSPHNNFFLLTDNRQETTLFTSPPTRRAHTRAPQTRASTFEKNNTHLLLRKSTKTRPFFRSHPKTARPEASPKQQQPWRRSMAARTTLTASGSAGAGEWCVLLSLCFRRRRLSVAPSLSLSRLAAPPTGNAHAVALALARILCSKHAHRRVSSRDETHDDRFENRPSRHNPRPAALPPPHPKNNNNNSRKGA